MDLEPLDPAYVAERLSQPPFIVCSGVYNVRDIGGCPTQYGIPVRRGFVYRSGEVSGITDEGRKQLKYLGVTTVYDLRSDTEMERYNTPIPDIPGVDIVRTPVFQTEDYSPEMMAKRYELYASGKTEAFMELYSQILDNGGPAFGVILGHIRDRPHDGLLFHCTAGKDRTGVIAAIMLTLAGVEDNVIAEDYSLTRVGREPARAMVMARLAKISLFARNNEAALNMFTCRPETMIAFLALLREKYGGVAAYLRKYVRLTDVDIETIKHNLLYPPDQPS
ncbi:hypothetical protein OE88DRAFT_1692127 [Heliocybe sulcata]|uniref:Tyrosine specific protein phosphatases domain-containing protein n=1 Tax=Heliocybe sulcata TaxID=5364 RepID=A0A5C3NPL2_9AGAM|nr:hypothetical protein OE88DRAFT_1692127 [Heliocybe sulcata]